MASDLLRKGRVGYCDFVIAGLSGISGLILVFMWAPLSVDMDLLIEGDSDPSFS